MGGCQRELAKFRMEPTAAAAHFGTSARHRIQYTKYRAFPKGPMQLRTRFEQTAYDRGTSDVVDTPCQLLP
jgi:hypothetical protein